MKLSEEGRSKAETGQELDLLHQTLSQVVNERKRTWRKDKLCIATKTQGSQINLKKIVTATQPSANTTLMSQQLSTSGNTLHQQKRWLKDQMMVSIY